MKKFYIFYLKSDGEIELYAYTTDKGLRNEFMRTRDMKKFIYKKVKLSHDDMNEMYKEYQNCELHKFMAITKISTTSQATDCNIVTTKAESIRAYDVGSMMLYEFLYEFLNVCPFIFKRKYKEALDDIGYTELYKAEQNSEMPFTVSVDTLGSFIHLYGDLLKGGINR